MSALADRSFNALLDDVAAQTPSPGGGCAAAWTCALAAALTQMAAEFGDGEDLAQLAARLRADALDLGERELDSYAPVLEALRLPRSDPERAERLRAALSAASESPLGIARAAAQVAELAAHAAAATTPHLRADAQAAALLAEGACRAATGLVEINLAEHPDDPRLAEAAALARRAAQATARA
jgi:formiminotetrahydrofolate cyclodeaminase